MKSWVRTCFALTLGVLATPATAADAPPQAPQPPMNSLQFAFYECDAGAFEIDYDSDTPTQATVTVSEHNRRYELKRAQADSGVAFAGAGVKFWTDGKKVRLDGTSPHLDNCKMKHG
jgi:membrane-bound inhibitor of C-type lysozyme